MAEVSLSVVIPVFNEARHVPATIDTVLTALEGSGFEGEIVVVDDGSSDGSDEAARAALDGAASHRVLSGPNRGRFEARRTGVNGARGELVLLLDARVLLHPDSLRFVRERLDSGARVWNGHVDIDTDNPLGVFWRLLAELAWADYFDHPRTTSFGASDFDRFPKGTTCFLAPRELLVDAFASFRTHYRDVRLANDDTPVLRAIAGRERIWISPQFSCVYKPRESVRAFARHAVRRGAVFLDGHGTPDSRFFPFVAAFFPLSAALAIASVRRPLAAPAALAACGATAAAYGVKKRRSPAEIRALALVTPLYALCHGVGMWRGAAELVRARVDA